MNINGYANFNIVPLTHYNNSDVLVVEGSIYIYKLWC